MASAPVDLELRVSVTRGRLVEISKHREQVMSSYNKYQDKGYFEPRAGLTIISHWPARKEGFLDQRRCRSFTSSGG